jgi:hypothetical protein
LAFERYFIARTRSKTEGELLDELRSILGAIYGDRLWSILVTDPDTRKVDKAARIDLEKRIATRKEIEGPLTISDLAKATIIEKFFEDQKIPALGKPKSRTYKRHQRQKT